MKANDVMSEVGRVYDQFNMAFDVFNIDTNTREGRFLLRTLHALEGIVLDGTPYEGAVEEMNGLLEQEKAGS